MAESLFNKAAGAACNFTKKGTLAQVFSREFCKTFNNTFFHRTPLVAASVQCIRLFVKLQTSSDQHHYKMNSYTGPYSERSQISKMKVIVKVINGFNQLTILAKKIHLRNLTRF